MSKPNLMLVVLATCVAAAPIMGRSLIDPLVSGSADDNMMQLQSNEQPEGGPNRGLSAVWYKYQNRYILVGGGNSDLYVKCDTTTWQCVGTFDRNQATIFQDNSWTSSSSTSVPGGVQIQLKVKNTNLCLNLYGGTGGTNVNLYGCSTSPGPDNENWFPTTMTVSTGRKSSTTVPIVRVGLSATSKCIRWNGQGQLLAAPCSTSYAYEFIWRLVYVDQEAVIGGGGF